MPLARNSFAGESHLRKMIAQQPMNEPIAFLNLLNFTRFRDACLTIILAGLLTEDNLARAVLL